MKILTNTNYNKGMMFGQGSKMPPPIPDYLNSPTKKLTSDTLYSAKKIHTPKSIAKTMAGLFLVGLFIGRNVNIQNQNNEGAAIDLSQTELQQDSLSYTQEELEKNKNDTAVELLETKNSPKQDSINTKIKLQNQQQEKEALIKQRKLDSIFLVNNQRIQDSITQHKNDSIAADNEMKRFKDQAVMDSIEAEYIRQNDELKMKFLEIQKKAFDDGIEILNTYPIY